MNEDAKHQDMEQPNEYERELIEQLNLLDAVDRLMTPEHIAKRFQELLQAVVSDAAATGGRPSDPAPPAGDRTLHRRLAVPAIVGSRDISRTADRAVETSEWLAVPGRDLRVMKASGREETTAMLAELRELLRRCPAGAFGPQASAMILTRVAELAEALIADRDERTALRLMRAALPHMALLGRWHPATFEVRRAHAAAWCELGHYRRAERLLRRLSEDERQVCGNNPWTALLLLWALVGSQQLPQADAGFRALADLLDRPQEANPLIQRHVQCRQAWLLAQRGLDGESEKGYDFVIAQRSSELDYVHPDTLDARHSKGKMLVLAGDGYRAAKVLEPLIEDRIAVLGADHPDTLETRKYLHLAWALTEPRDKGVLGRADQELKEIHRIQANRHGRDHPMSRDTAAQLRRLRKLRRAVDSRAPIPGLRQTPSQDREPGRRPHSAPPQPALARTLIPGEAVRN